MIIQNCRCLSLKADTWVLWPRGRDCNLASEYFMLTDLSLIGLITIYL